MLVAGDSCNEGAEAVLQVQQAITAIQNYVQKPFVALEQDREKVFHLHFSIGINDLRETNMNVIVRVKFPAKPLGQLGRVEHQAIPPVATVAAPLTQKTVLALVGPIRMYAK